jgi:hypothetical protein
VPELVIRQWKRRVDALGSRHRSRLNLGEDRDRLPYALPAARRAATLRSVGALGVSGQWQRPRALPRCYRALRASANWRSIAFSPSLRAPSSER